MSTTTGTAVAVPVGDGESKTIIKTDIADSETQFRDAALAHLKEVGAIDGEPITDKPAKETPRETKYVREIARLQKEVRERATKLKELESKAEKAALWDKVKETYGKDRTAALGLLADKDPLDEAAAFMAEYYADSDGKGDDGAAAAPQGDVAKALAPLMEKLDAALKKIETLEQGHTAQATKATEAQTAERNKAALEFAKEFVTKRADKFELCARTENFTEAADLAEKAVATIAAAEGIEDIEALSPEDSTALLERAYAQVEEAFEEQGKKYSKGDARPAYNFHRPPPAPRPTVITAPGPTASEEEWRQYGLKRLGLL